MSNSVSKALGWKLLERFGVQGMQFVLQIVLARILSPEHYGTLSLMIVFTNLANVFIQSGFNTALVRKKDIDDDDYSSVFWASTAIAAIIYIILFFSAPLIARVYEMPEIVSPFRVLGLMLFPGAFNSIQIAKVRRELNFKKIFTSNIIGIFLAGGIGIAMAYSGFGLWSLVAQTLLSTTTICIVMLITVKWRPRLVCKFKKLKELLSFGWKLLVASLIDVLYQDVRSLVIGVKYDSSSLGYYNRGKQFPQFIINAINTSVQAVMLPAMAKEQDEKEKVKALMRRSIITSAYIIFPMMTGLAIISAPLISLLLTDKWLPAVPYMQIYCFSLAFYPVHTCNLQAISAMGRSDITLRLEIIKKSIGVTALVIAIFCFNSPIAIAFTGIITTLISCFINAFPNKKLVGYSYFEQMRDILPNIIISAIMGVAIHFIQYLQLSNLLLLIIQIPVGIILYVLLSMLFRVQGFKYAFEPAMNVINKKLKRNKK